MMNKSHSSSIPVLGNSLLVHRILFSLLIPAIGLTAMSLLTLFSIDGTLFRNQLIFFFVALAAYIFFLNIDVRIFGIFSKYIYVGMIILLVLIFAIGFEAKGATRWVSILGVSVQFSEIIKPFYVIVIGYFLSRNESRSFSKFIQTLLLMVPIFFLTLKQPDLGNAIIYLLITLFMMLMYGFPLRYFLLLAVCFLVPLPFLFQFLHGYQKQRLMSFVHTTQDPFASGYNAIQALISVGSGGFIGKGYGSATQSILRFLPERHSDFIFATISESFGFVGDIILLALFAFLLYKLYKISLSIHDTFSHIVVMGFYALLFVHMFFNIGMNIGLLPIVGITLPFVSYGGSSLLTNFIILGIVSSLSFEFRRHRSIEIK